MTQSSLIAIGIIGAILSLALVAVLQVTVYATEIDQSSGNGDLRFRPSGLSGGGFVNVLAVNPFDSGHIVAGSDVGGFQVSRDYGDTWLPSNAGVAEVSNGVRAQLSVAAIAFSTKVPNKVYAGTGRIGKNGGFFVSADGGVTWERRSTFPQFSGGNNVGVGSLPVPHPRSTGRLIALDDKRDLIYAGSFSGGVMRSADDGCTWSVLGLTGKHIRSLAMDPDDAGTLYVATYGDGVWKTTTAMGDGKFARLEGSPNTVEELLVLNGSVYAAAGSDGVFRSKDGGQTWERLGEGQIAIGLGSQSISEGGPLATPVWRSIDGYSIPGGAVVLFSGNWYGEPQGNLRKSVMRSLDGGESWEAITTDRDSIHYEMGGPSGPIWWMKDGVGGQLADAGYLAAQIVVDPNNHSRVYLTGRAGVWRTENAESRRPDWYPVVRYQNTTINHAVAADPNVSGRVYIGNTDRRLFVSADHLESVTNSSPAQYGDTQDIVVDPSTTPSRIYLATTDGSGRHGEIYSSPDPLSGGWVNEGLELATGGKAPLAVAFGKENETPVILAAVAGSGIWRKSGGKWTRVSDEAMGLRQTTNQASFFWEVGSPFAYLYDRQSGVWRSDNCGRTWSKIWGKPSPEDFTGYVLADPVQADALYVSARDGVYLMEGATKGTVEGGEIQPRLILRDASKPGPIAYSKGWLYVAAQVSTFSPAKLLRSRDQGKTWEDVADGYYRANAKFPNAMSIGPDGYIYVALQNIGAVVGVPLP